MLTDAEIAARYVKICPYLDERQRRLWLGVEALALGGSMLGVILALLILPLAASLACALLPGPAKVGPAVTGTCGVASFGLVLALVPAAAHHDLSYLSYLRVDALSAIFLLATAFLYAAVSVYSIGYVRHHGRGDHYACASTPG